MWKINLTYEPVCEQEPAMPSVSTVTSAPLDAPSPAAAPSRSGERRLRELDRLLERSCAELAALYAGARAPRLGDVAGDLRGRMLAWPMLEGRTGVARTLRALAGTRSFPWRGKTFAPDGEAAGTGINRVVSDRIRLFPFRTFIGRSKAGDFDALQLDYALPSNPPVIRSIEDEIRELEPGLWLGQAYLRTRRGPFLWLYFALARTDG
jgi:hypothetical protein